MQPVNSITFSARSSWARVKYVHYNYSHTYLPSRVVKQLIYYFQGGSNTYFKGSLHFCFIQKTKKEGDCEKEDDATELRSHVQYGHATDH